jgi:oligopeptide/dipeptide ABC transporter ATP-binding protein
MSSEAIIQTENVKKWFEVRGSFLGTLLRSQAKEYIKAVDGISIDVQKGEVFAIVGESGCGKTTLARLILQLEKISAGKVFFNNEDITSLSPADASALKTKIQLIFQDPYGSLNPSMRIGEIIAEPLKIHNVYNTIKEEDNKVKQAMEEVGLTPVEDFIKRFPHELSGGQRQRTAVAAALVLDPELLIADEPVSMLDVSMRGQILKLLLEIRERKKISIIIITHNLAVARQISDRIAVTYLGRVVETGNTQKILRNPKHPYTKALVSVVPVPDPTLKREKLVLTGEIPSPINLPIGCRFNPRCPFVIDACLREDPQLTPISELQNVACIRAEDID